MHIGHPGQVFGLPGMKPESRKCESMAVILDEGDEIIRATADGAAQRNVGLRVSVKYCIFAFERIEQYEE